MKRNIITFIMIAVLTAPVLQAADCGSGTLSTVPERAQLHLPDSKSPVSECTIARYIPDDTVLGYNSGYTVGDRTVMFVDPGDCGGPGADYEITGLSFVILDPNDFWDARDFSWPVTLDVVVFDEYASDSCYGPGAELCRKTVVCDSLSFAYPAVGTVTFDTPCCVDRPFFIGVEYTTPPTSGLLPSIMFDYSSEPDTCHLFQYCCDSIWVGWYAYWVTVPGYPFFDVHLETESSACCDDSDADGVCDAVDVCPGFDDGLDADGDGVPDGCDVCAGHDDNLDADLDGFADGCDNCPDISNVGQTDTDSDNVGDACDNCSGTANTDQWDTDLDGLGNACDPDDDGDGFDDGADNCPSVYNPGQEDGNTDGVGDACSCQGDRGNVDCGSDNMVDVGDLTALIDHLFITFKPLCCLEEADVSPFVLPDGSVDVADLTALIDHLFISFGPLPACP